MDGDVEDVVVIVADLLFVEVVAEPRCMRKQMPDRHTRLDHVTRGTEGTVNLIVQMKHTVLNEGHHGDCSEGLRPTSNRELGLGCVRYLMSAIRVPCGSFVQDSTMESDLRNAVELRLVDHRVES